MMNDNGHREHEQTPLLATCHGCGKAVDLERDDILVETTRCARSLDENEVTWHQVCFNTFLDDGEEI